MEEIKGKKATDPLKMAGGAVLFVASIALMIHRMPHRGYVEVHADKPRPAASAAPSAPTPAQPLPVAPSRRPSPPASRAPDLTAPPTHASEPAPSAIPAAVPAAAPAPAIDAEDLADDCRSEAAILCYKIPTQGLARCLKEYDDALMVPCRRALKNFRSPRRPVDSDESGN